MTHSPLARMLGIYILDERTKQEISQRSLAKHLGFTPQFMGNIEKGRVMLPYGALVKAIVFLDLDAAQLRKIYRLANDEEFSSLMKDIDKQKTGSWRNRGKVRA